MIDQSRLLTGVAVLAILCAGCTMTHSVAPNSGIASPPIALDSVDPKYHDYLTRVRQMIKEKWTYPCVKEKSWFSHETCGYKNAELQIEFVIAQDGSVLLVVVRQPSTFAIYNDYAVDAIKRAAPFPPVPENLMTRTVAGLRLRANFSYTLDQRPLLDAPLR